MNNEVFNENVRKYADAAKAVSDLKKRAKELKAEMANLETSIKQFMVENEVDAISVKNIQISLGTQKISKTFKRDSMVKRLKEKVGDTSTAEELTDWVMNNRIFDEKPKLKTKVTE
jgi:regulator of replication initiation timing